MDPQLLFWGVLGFYVLVGVTFIYVLLCGESVRVRFVVWLRFDSCARSDVAWRAHVA